MGEIYVALSLINSDSNLNIFRFEAYIWSSSRYILYLSIRLYGTSIDRQVLLFQNRDRNSKKYLYERFIKSGSEVTFFNFKSVINIFIPFLSLLYA